jgi:hypothetical protein
MVGREDRDVLALSLRKDHPQIGMERDCELRARLLLNNLDRVAGDVRPCHTVNVAPSLPGVEHQGKRQTSFRADRPTRLELHQLDVGP